MIQTCNIGGKIVRYLDESTFTMLGGRTFKLIGGERRGPKFIQTVKNDQGEIREFDHEELMDIIEQYP